MKNSFLAKLLGWSQFGLQVLGQVSQSVQSNGAPHGWANWLGFGASLATAIALHKASSTDGSK